MKIVCATVCYRGYGQDEFLDTLADARLAGYEYIDIHGEMGMDMRFVNDFPVAWVRRMLSDTGLKLAGIYPPCLGGVDDADVEVRAQGIAKVIRSVEQLGGFHVDTTAARHRDGDIPADLDRIVMCLNRVLELTKGSKILIAVENHLNSVLEQIEDFDHVFNAVKDPRVGFCLDTGHFHAANVDIMKLMDKFEDRLHALHIKDHIGKKSVGIGRGDIDLPGLIHRLQAIGFDKCLLVELENPDKDNTKHYTREALAYLSGLLGRKF